MAADNAYVHTCAWRLLASVTYVATYIVALCIQCDPSEATWQLIDEVVLKENEAEQPKITFFGGGCSLATEPVAALSGRFYMIPQVSTQYV